MQASQFVQETRSDFAEIRDLAHRFVSRTDELNTLGIDIMLANVVWEDIGITPEQFKLAIVAAEFYLAFWELHKKEIYEASS